MANKKRAVINDKAPKGWFLAGTHPFDYEASLDKTEFHSGKQSCCIVNLEESPKGWTTLMQNMGPALYFNKRLRMRFWLRLSEVSGSVEGWMRIDGPAPKKEMVAFDNMCKRGISGTTEWFEEEIILDVPEESTNIGFGIILQGAGKVWVDDVTFDIASRTMPTTDCECMKRSRPNFQKPKNLNFED